MLKAVFTSQCVIIYLILSSFTLLGFQISVVSSTYCTVSTPRNDVTTTGDPEKVEQPTYAPIIKCPTISDPYDHTECCPGENGKCCPSPRKFYEIDNTVATIVSVVVILICAMIAICMIICCFWSPCPLYTSCRMQYTHDVASCASKLGEPPEPPKDTLKKSAVQVISIPNKNGSSVPLQGTADV